MRSFVIALLLNICWPVAVEAADPAPARPDLNEVLEKEFEVVLLSGKSVPLSELVEDGRPVIIEFWATWCAPCRKTLPHLIELQEKYGNQLVVVGLTVEDPDKHQEKVRRFVSEQSVNFQIAFAPDELFQYMNSRQDIAVPKFFLFDNEGRLVSYIPRYSPFTGRHIRSAVRKAISRK